MTKIKFINRNKNLKSGLFGLSKSLNSLEGFMPRILEFEKRKKIRKKRRSIR